MHCTASSLKVLGAPTTPSTKPLECLGQPLGGPLLNLPAFDPGPHTHIHQWLAHMLKLKSRSMFQINPSSGTCSHVAQLWSPSKNTAAAAACVASSAISSSRQAMKCPEQLSAHHTPVRMRHHAHHTHPRCTGIGPSARAVKGVGTSLLCTYEHRCVHKHQEHRSRLVGVHCELHMCPGAVRW